MRIQRSRVSNEIIENDETMSSWWFSLKRFALDFSKRWEGFLLWCMLTVVVLHGAGLQWSVIAIFLWGLFVARVLARDMAKGWANLHVWTFRLRPSPEFLHQLLQWPLSEEEKRWQEELKKMAKFAPEVLAKPSNSQFEFLGGVERRVVVETSMHEGEEVHPAGKTQIARERAEVIKEGLAAH